MVSTRVNSSRPRRPDPCLRQNSRDSKSTACGPCSRRNGLNSGRSSRPQGTPPNLSNWINSRLAGYPVSTRSSSSKWLSRTGSRRPKCCDMSSSDCSASALANTATAGNAANRLRLRACRRNPGPAFASAASPPAKRARGTTSKAAEVPRAFLDVLPSHCSLFSMRQVFRRLAPISICLERQSPTWLVVPGCGFVICCRDAPDQHGNRNLPA